LKTRRSKLVGGFRVARVLTAEPHPQADKLQVLTVDSGDGNPLQVVCGAPNARAGLVGVFGVEGAVCARQWHGAEEDRHPGSRIEWHDVLGRANWNWATTMTASSSFPPMRRWAWPLPNMQTRVIR
jgi:hypothetical protein